MKSKIIFIALWIIIPITHAQISVSGRITNDKDEPLPGASLLIVGSTHGTSSNSAGDYTITSSKELPWTVEITFVGYTSRTLKIDAPGNQQTIKLTPITTVGGEVIITASRIHENAIEVLSSVTSLNEKHIEASPVNGDPSEYLRNVQGVNVIRGGTQTSNIELRGPVNVLESSTLVLRDYAPLTASSDKILLTAVSGLSPLDIATVEIVRGPSGALYGSNVTSGVVHFITKDAFKYPGVSTMVSVGERNLFTSRIRYAGNKGQKLGWKFLINYNQSNNFSIPEAQLIANDGSSKVIIPQNFETPGGKKWNDIDNIDDILLYSLNFEGGFEYRVNDKTKINYTADFSRALSNIALPIGFIFLGSKRMEHQLRFSAGNFFATFYHRSIFANVDGNGNPNGSANHAFTFNYTAGAEGQTQMPEPQSSEKYFDGSLQYRVTISDKLDFQIGSDLKLSPAFDKVFIYGNSSGDNAYNIYGSYISGKYKFNDQLAFNAAGRYDYFSAYQVGAFSPRLGLVYNPKVNTAIRLSFSRSYQGQSRERTFLDFNFSTILPPFFPSSRIVGVAQPVTYNNPVTRFAFGDVNGGESYQLQDIVNALAANAGVTAPTVSGVVSPTVTTAFFAAPEVGFSTGVPIKLSEAGLRPPVLRAVNQIELGFNKTFNQKIKISADIYNIWIENIQPTGEVPLTPGAQLDITAIQTQIEQQVPAGPDRDALITSLNLVPFNPTPNPGFNGTPGYGAIMSDRAQQLSYVFEIGFPTYGNKNVNYIGTELSGEYFFNPGLSAFVNYSFISKTVWSAADLHETNPQYGYYLNTAPHRVNIGVTYYPLKGAYGSIAMNYQSEYEGRQGDGRFFTGINKARSICDARLGYRFKTTKKIKFDLAVTVNNLFDTKYSYFVHLPQMRRWSSLTLKVSL